MASTPSTTTSPTEERPQKRTRIEDDDTVPVIIKSSDLWLPDGNIILRTVATSPTSSALQRTLYKVHKGVLSLHSSFFRDLSGGPQAAFAIGSESYEELPVMDMPDSADDVAHFLKALYFPEYTQRHHATSCLKALPDGYAGILRLATKYDVQNLRETTVTAFKLVWPPRLAIWHELQMTILKDGPFPEVPEGLLANVSQLYEDPAKAIRLATDCNVPEVLPVAFYDLVHVYARNGQCGPKYHRRYDVSILTHEELMSLLAGIGALQDLMVTQLLSLPDGIHKPHMYYKACVHPLKEKGVCGDHLRSLWLQQVQTMDSSSGDVLMWLHTMANELEAGEACAVCKGNLKNYRLSVRDGIWRRLPTYFNLTKRVGDNWAEV